MFYELIYNSFPYNGNNKEELLNNILASGEVKEFPENHDE